MDLYSLDNNSAERDILIKHDKSVETKETKVSDVSISESQNDQNLINSNARVEELDALIRELQMYDQAVADICEVNIPGEFNDVIISNDKENYTVLSPMSCSNIVGGLFPPVDNIPTESSTLLGNSSSDILNINENL